MGNTQEIKDKNILQGNIAIAKYMGAVSVMKHDPFYPNDPNKVKEYILFGAGICRDEIWNGKAGATVETRAELLMYHRYYYWLMPVWIKLRNEATVRSGLEGALNNYLAQIAERIAWGPIEATFFKVVETIDYINSNPSDAKRQEQK